MAAPVTRAELRARLWEITTSCEWPGCQQPRTEVAHLHSIGMGGRASADVLENVAALCWGHARLSDGEQPAGWSIEEERADLWEAAYDLPFQPGPGTPAWWVAQALRIVVADTRGWVA